MTGSSDRVRVERRNYRAAPVDLYDLPGPMHWHLSLRNAIESHRDGERAPVAIFASKDGVVV